jgi:hypothetical protein
MIIREISEELPQILTQAAPVYTEEFINDEWIG